MSDHLIVRTVTLKVNIMDYNISKSAFFIKFFSIFLITLLGLSFLIGCDGGNRLIPRDLKDYVSYALKTPRRNVNVDQTFNTTISLRVDQMDVNGARKAVRDLISKCVEYFRRDNVNDYLQSTLIFHVRLTTDADQYLKWRTSADNMRDLVKERMTEEEFLALCEKEEYWDFMP